MLRDEALEEFKQGGYSESLRRDCDKLRELRRELDAQMTPDQYVDFLTSCAKIFGPYTPREPIHYTNVRL